MSNIVKKEFTYDEDKLHDMIIAKETDEVAKFYSDNAANEMIAQILNKMDINHQEVQNGMYPELWKTMRKTAVKKMDFFTFLMEETIKKELYEILENEKTNPIQKPEDRPEQDPEEKEKGLLFTDKLEIPEVLKQQQTPDIPDINIYEKFKDKDIKDIVNEAMENVKKNPNWSISPEGEEVFTENLVNCKALDDAINNKTISIDQMEQLVNQIGLCTDENFANIFIWEIFEMPEMIKQMLDQYNQTMNQIQQNAVPNSDASYVFINPVFKTDEIKTFEEAKLIVENNIESAFEAITESFPDINTTLEDTIKASFPVVKKWLAENDEFLQYIIDEKILKEDMRDILQQVSNIIIAADLKGIEPDVIAEEEENIKWCAFNMIHIFFPPPVDKNKVESKESGAEIIELAQHKNKGSK